MTNSYQKKNTEAMAYEIREVAATKLVNEGSKQASQFFQEANPRIQQEYDKLCMTYLGYISTDEADKELLKVKLRDEHFRWVDDCFARAANFPQPTPTSLAIMNSTTIAGDTPLNPPSETEGPLDYLRESSGTGMYSKITFENIHNIIDSLADWQSAAGTAFKDRYIAQISSTAANQLIVLKTLRNLATANQTLLQLASKDVFTIGNNTIAVIEADDMCCGTDAEVNAFLNTVAGVATIVAGIASIPLTGGATSAVVAGATTALAGALTTYTSAGGMNAPEDGIEKQLGADTISGILDNMREAVESVYSSLDDANSSMAAIMNDVYDSLIYSPGQFVAPLSSTIRDATMDTIIDDVESDTD